jgi:hypothetical protein
MKINIILCLAVCPVFFLHGTVWCVGQGGLPHIQNGLDSCAANDTVLVGPGIYEENIMWPNVDGIYLVSEKSTDSTTIDCWNPVYFHHRITPSTVMKNFFVTLTYYSMRHETAGIWCYQASPTICNNKVTVATTYVQIMAGIVCQESSPVICENRIINCYNTGWYMCGILCINDSSFIHDNVISGTFGNYGGGIYCLNSNAMLYKNEISDTDIDSGGGIICKHSSPIVSHCTIKENAVDGVYCCEGSSPVIHFCNIMDNAVYGVRNVDSNVIVDARFNWWGDSTGPYHPVTNPGGFGNAVSDYVLFEPWFTEPVGIEEEEIRNAPSSLSLSAVPNPSRGKTVFKIDGHIENSGSLCIYNAVGQIVTRFELTPGPNDQRAIVWDGGDEQGLSVPNGVYFVKFSTAKQHVSQKLILLR